MVGDYPTTDTKIDLTSLPEAERELHWKAQRILEKHVAYLDELMRQVKVNPSALDYVDNIDLQGNEKIIVEKSTYFLRLRVLKLFRETMKFELDKWRQFIFDIRFSWFLDQFNLYAKQDTKEKAILQRENLTEKQITAELEKLAEAHITPWTLETWDKFWKEKVEPNLKFSEELIDDLESNKSEQKTNGIVKKENG